MSNEQLAMSKGNKELSNKSNIYEVIHLIGDKKDDKIENKAV